MNTLAQAREECRKSGAARATGDGLRAMFADLIMQMHGGSAAKYYAHLQKHAINDEDVMAMSKVLLDERSRAWDILIA